VDNLISYGKMQALDDYVRYQCPSCRRPGNRLVICNKGTYLFIYCHTSGCKYNKGQRIRTVPTSESVKAILHRKNNVSTRFVKDLPYDYSTSMPKAFREYLIKYDLQNKTDQYKIGYSPTENRLIIPTNDGYLARSITEQPKWKNYTRELFVSGEAPYHGSIVIVEDPLSCIKVGEVCKSLALLKTNLEERFLKRIIKCGMVYIWLDGDRAGIMGAYHLINMLSPYVKTRIIHTKKDPKELTLWEIGGKLNEGN